MPRYNSKRRSAATIARRRSFSQSSICSQSSHPDQQSAYRSAGYGQSRCGSTAPSPSPSRVSIAFTDVSTASKRPSAAHGVDSRDFGTLPMRKFAPELIKTTSGGHESVFTFCHLHTTFWWSNGSCVTMTVCSLDIRISTVYPESCLTLDLSCFVIYSIDTRKRKKVSFIRILL